VLRTLAKDVILDRRSSNLRLIQHLLLVVIVNPLVVTATS